MKEKLTAYKKKWHEENKEKIAAYKIRYYQNNKEELAAYKKKWYEENKDRVKKYREDNKEKIKKWREDNKEELAVKKKRYYQNNKENYKKYSQDNKYKINAYWKKYYEANKERISTYNKKWREDNKENRAAYERKKRKTNPLYKMKVNLRNRTYKVFKTEGYEKGSTTEKMLGISYEKVKLHIERQFTDGMNWNNQGEWHIDHIIPLSSANTEAELLKLCHYRNLQPLWAVDNISKGATITQVQIQMKL